MNLRAPTYLRFLPSSVHNGQVYNDATEPNPRFGIRHCFLELRTFTNTRTRYPSCSGGSVYGAVDPTNGTGPRLMESRDPTTVRTVASRSRTPKLTVKLRRGHHWRHDLVPVGIFPFPALRKRTKLKLS